jgi:hypothetical protein
VAYLFNRKGVVIVPKGALSEDDSSRSCSRPAPRRSTTIGDSFEIVSEATDFVAVRKALQEAGIDYDSAEASFVPSVEVPLDLDGARKMMRVIDALEDSDDVQNVFANGDVSDEVLAQLDDEDRRVRVLGVDPGLTRCGLGVVDGRPGRAGMVAVGVVRTPSDASPGERLVYLGVDNLTSGCVASSPMSWRSSASSPTSMSPPS